MYCTCTEYVYRPYGPKVGRGLAVLYRHRGSLMTVRPIGELRYSCIVQALSFSRDRTALSVVED